MNLPDQYKLSEFFKGRVGILGFGNRLWRDDGAGSVIAEALSACPDFDAVDGGFVPENYLEKVIENNPETVLLIDAADFDGQPGEVRLLQPDELMPGGLSTHAGSPQMLARYFEARCGARVGLLAIQPGDVSEGDELSPEVAAAVSHLVKMLPAFCQPQ